MKPFTAEIAGASYTDPALFENAAKAWRGPRTAARKAFGIAPTVGDAEAMARAIRRGWRGPSLKPEGRNFRPQGYEVGAAVTLEVRGAAGTFTTEAQIWCLAPERGVWAVSEIGRPYWVNPRTGEVQENGGAIGRVLSTSSTGELEAA